MKLLRTSLLFLALQLLFAAPPQSHADTTDSALRDSVRELSKDIKALEWKLELQAQANDLGKEALDRALSAHQGTLNLFDALVGLISILLLLFGAAVTYAFFHDRALLKSAKTVLDEIAQYRDSAKASLEEMIRKIPSEIPFKKTKPPSSEELASAQNATQSAEIARALGAQLSAEHYFGIGNAHYIQGRFLDALKAYEEAVRLKPEYAEAWNNKGVTLGQLGRSEEELRAYDEAIRLKSDFADPWYNKGVALGLLGRPEEELKAYDEAIRVKSNYESAWYNKGVTLWQGGKPEEALNAYEEAIRCKPDYARAWYNKSCLYSTGKNKEEALNHLKKAIEFDEPCRKRAKSDKDFDWLWNDEDFKKIVGE